MQINRGHIILVLGLVIVMLMGFMSFTPTEEVKINPTPSRVEISELYPTQDTIGRPAVVVVPCGQAAKYPINSLYQDYGVDNLEIVCISSEGFKPVIYMDKDYDQFMKWYINGANSADLNAIIDRIGNE